LTEGKMAIEVTVVMAVLTAGIDEQQVTSADHTIGWPSVWLVIAILARNSHYARRLRRAKFKGAEVELALSIAFRVADP
jgi:hypothetical protein